MIIAMDSNQKKFEEKTKLANKMQGDENYVLMLGKKQQNHQKKLSDLAEYKANFQEDLLARLTQRGQQQEKERRLWMAKKQQIRE